MLMKREASVKNSGCIWSRCGNRQHGGEILYKSNHRTIEGKVGHLEIEKSMLDLRDPRTLKNVNERLSLAITDVKPVACGRFRWRAMSASRIHAVL